MENHKDAVWELIEAGGRTAQSFGLNRLLGQIYFLLYLSRDPRSLDDMMEQLGVSKASVSIACRQLLSWGLIRRVWKKGDRKDYYEAVTDLGQLVNNGLIDSINKKLVTAETQIEKSLAMLTESECGESEDRNFIKQRLEEAQKHRNRISKLINNPLVRKLL